MRAIFTHLVNLEVGQIVTIDGEDASHLIKVARAKIGEKVVVLNGKGLVAKSQILTMNKKSVELEVVDSKIIANKKINIDVLLGAPKKDAFEQIICSCVEFGVNKLFYFKSQYSNFRELNSKRIETLIISSLKQSNNPFKLETIQISQLENFNFNQYDYVIHMDPKSKDGSELKKFVQRPNSILLVVGPEGGLSVEENNFLSALENNEILNLDCPILRSPTAVVAGLGYLKALCVNTN